MIGDISINFGGSIIYPVKLVADAGLSLVYMRPERLDLGIVFNTTKLKCSECNTPIAEIVGGSLVIRSRHHGGKHITAIPIKQLQRYNF